MGCAHPRQSCQNDSYEGCTAAALYSTRRGESAVDLQSPPQARALNTQHHLHLLQLTAPWNPHYKLRLCSTVQQSQRPNTTAAWTSSSSSDIAIVRCPAQLSTSFIMEKAQSTQNKICKTKKQQTKFKIRRDVGVAGLKGVCMLLQSADLHADLQPPI